MNRDLTAPYPGLRPFERHEAAIFFGREEQVDQLLDKLGETHFLAVLGLSGSGKSSLVRAGLLPALEAGNLAGAGPRWQVAELRPGERPMGRLAEALCEQTDWGRNGGEGPEALAADLRRGARALNWRLGVRPLAEGVRLLLLVDQFEELFRYGHQAEAAAFVALLLEAAGDPGCYVVITLRSEFLGECGAYPGLPEAINAGLFLTPALTPEQLADAIQLPVRLPQFNGEVEPALVRRLLAEAQEVPDALPLLQHALLRLWEGEARRLDLARFQEALGGLQQALNNHLEQAYNELNEAHRRVAEQLFRCLVEPGKGGRDTRRPVRAAEVAAVAGVEIAGVAAAAEPFRRAGRTFLTPGPELPLAPESVLDITHEALIRQWRRLQAWTKDEAEQADLYRRLEASAQRHGKGEEALWIDPGLQIALAWRENHSPGPHWARRYGGDFEKAMAFLDASREARETARREQEQLRRRALRRARTVAVASLMALTITLGLATWAWVERANARNAEQHRSEALFDSGLTHASLLARVDDPQAAQAVLAETATLDPIIPAPRRHARNLLAGYVEISGGAAERVYEGAGAALLRNAVSPDGRLLAAAGERGTLVLFEAESGRLLRRLEGHGPKAGDAGAVSAVLFSADGSLLYSAGDDGRIRRWSMPQGDPVGEPWRASSEVWALALSPDGQRLASAGKGDGITLWSTQEGVEKRTLKGGKASSIADGNTLAFTPDGRLISGSYNGEVGLWDPATGTEQPLPRIHADQVNAVAVSPDGRYLATGGSDKRIVLWQLEPKGASPLRLLQGHTNRVVGLRFAPGHRLLSASHDNSLRLWELSSGAALRLFQGHSAGLGSIALHGESIYTAANDATLRRWALATPGQWLWELPGSPSSAAIDPVGGSVSVGFEDGTLRLYRLPEAGADQGPAAPAPLVEIADAHGDFITRQAYSPDSRWLATASHDYSAKIWRIDRAAAGPTLTLHRTLEGHTRAVRAVAFAPDGRTLATAGYDGQVGLFQVESGRGQLFAAHKGTAASVTFDRGGQHLLSAGVEDFQLRLWDLTQTPPQSREIARSQDRLLWAALRPDGRQLAAVGRGAGKVTLHNLTPEPTRPRRLVGHEQTVYRAAYTPDGTQLATVSSDMTLRLWDLTTDKPLFTLRLPTEFLNPSPLWDLSLQCLPPDAPGPDAGHCWIAVPLTVGRLALYRLPYDQPPPSIAPGRRPAPP